MNIFLFFLNSLGMGIGDWGLGIGDWGLGAIPNPQSPIALINKIIFKKYIHIIILNKLKILFFWLN